MDSDYAILEFSAIAGERLRYQKDHAGFIFMHWSGKTIRFLRQLVDLSKDGYVRSEVGSGGPASRNICSHARRLRGPQGWIVRACRSSSKVVSDRLAWEDLSAGDRCSK